MKTKIRQLAQELGFDQVGFTCPDALTQGEQAIQAWVAEGRHGSMKYLENFSERKQKFYEDFPDAKSVIVLGVNYYTGGKSEYQKPNVEKKSSFRLPHLGLTGRVARYAWGKDYHQILAARHQEFIQKLRKITGDSLKAKSCVDIQPIPERFAAVRAGFGFVGKHTGLLSKEFGPWLFLSEVVTNLDLEEDISTTGDCGTCTDCQTVCPTGALDQDYKMDARLCIAYWTIEHKGVIPREMRPKIKDWIFGCDECFAICPFTSKSKESRWPELGPQAGVGEWLPIQSLFEITSNKEYEKKFEGTALLRAGRKQMLRNACLVLANSGNAEAVPLLIKALQDSSPLVRLHAVWGLTRFQTSEAKEALKRHLLREKDSEVLSELNA